MNVHTLPVRDWRVPDSSWSQQRPAGSLSSESNALHCTPSRREFLTSSRGKIIIVFRLRMTVASIIFIQKETPAIPQRKCHNLEFFLKYSVDPLTFVFMTQLSPLTGPLRSSKLGQPLQVYIRACMKFETTALSTHSFLSNKPSSRFWRKMHFGCLRSWCGRPLYELIKIIGKRIKGNIPRWACIDGRVCFPNFFMTAAQVK